MSLLPSTQAPDREAAEMALLTAQHPAGEQSGSRTRLRSSEAACLGFELPATPGCGTLQGRWAAPTVHCCKSSLRSLCVQGSPQGVQMPAFQAAAMRAQKWVGIHLLHLAVPSLD